jgi:hypothetical protein
LQTNISSFIAPAAAILPFGIIFALCLWLLSLPGGQDTRSIDQTVAHVPQPSELRVSLSASVDESSGTSVPKPPAMEAGGSLSTVPVVDREAALSMMSVWWAERTRQRQTAAPKAAPAVRQSRRHREASQRQQACPASECIGAAPNLPDRRRWAYGGAAERD